MDVTIALHALDMFPKNSLLLLVQAKNHHEVWDVFFSGWLGIFGPPTSYEMDEGGWKNEVWADLCAERRIKLQFQGVGELQLELESRNGIARGIHTRLIEDGRFARRQIP